MSYTYYSKKREKTDVSFELFRYQTLISIFPASADAEEMAKREVAQAQDNRSKP